MKSYKFFALIAAVAALAACNRMETDTQRAGSHGDQVISLTSQVLTRATEDPQASALSTSNKVGVFVTSSSATITNGNNNEHSVGTDGALTTTSTMNYPAEDGAVVDIYAYAPYASGMTLGSNNAFSVSTDQSAESGYLSSDLVYASVTGQASTESAVSLTFAHKLSQLQITVQNDAEIDLSSATVYVTGTKIATTFNPSTGAVGTASGDATAVKAATGDVSTVYAIVVPQEIAASTELVKIVAGGKQYVAKLTNAATLSGGKAYKFTVKLTSSAAPVVEVPITLGTTTLTEWETPDDLGEETAEEGEVEPITLTATFQTPGSNASYDAPTYTWTGSTSNLMTVFEFSGGELANYHTLTFTFSNLVDGPVRMGYYVGTTFTEFGNGYYSEGEKTVDLTALGIDLSTVTKIAFGGKSSAGSCDILASDVILTGNGDGSTDSGDDSGDDSGNDSGNDGKLYATFGTPGGNASYDATSYTYTWTGSTNNVMQCFSFSNGELANYTTLNFTFSELSDDASVRINVLYSDNTSNSKAYYSAGTKATAITELLSGTYTAADVTAIRFAGNSGSGSCIVKASEMYLE